MPSKEAFVRIKMIDPGAYLHMLYGLQGAIEGIKDSLLSKSTKEEVNKRSNMSPMTMSRSRWPSLISRMRMTAFPRY
ncbi:MAG: TfoX/Sxy family DNA transformation protein [Bacillota bacterium]